MLGIGHLARKWIGVDAIAPHRHFLGRLLADHFGEDAVTGRIGQHLERLIESFAFFVRQRRIVSQPFALFDHDSKEILGARIDRHRTA